jgi:hypothetical protein
MRDKCKAESFSRGEIMQEPAKKRIFAPAFENQMR